RRGGGKARLAAAAAGAGVAGIEVQVRAAGRIAELGARDAIDHAVGAEAGAIASLTRTAQRAHARRRTERQRDAQHRPEDPSATEIAATNRIDSSTHALSSREHKQCGARVWCHIERRLSTRGS